MKFKNIIAKVLVLFMVLQLYTVIPTTAVLAETNYGITKVDLGDFKYLGTNTKNERVISAPFTTSMILKKGTKEGEKLSLVLPEEIVLARKSGFIGEVKSGSDVIGRADYDMNSKTITFTVTARGGQILEAGDKECTFEILVGETESSGISPILNNVVSNEGFINDALTSTVKFTTSSYGSSKEIDSTLKVSLTEEDKKFLSFFETSLVDLQEADKEIKATSQILVKGLERSFIEPTSIFINLNEQKLSDTIEKSVKVFDVTLNNGLVDDGTKKQVWPSTDSSVSLAETESGLTIQAKDLSKRSLLVEVTTIVTNVNSSIVTSVDGLTDKMDSTKKILVEDTINIDPLVLPDIQITEAVNAPRIQEVPQSNTVTSTTSSQSTQPTSTTKITTDSEPTTLTTPKAVENPLRSSTNQLTTNSLATSSTPLGSSPYTVYIKKVDTNNTSLPGAVFGLYSGSYENVSPTQNPVVTGTTGTNGILNLTWKTSGTYTLKEITPPSGYTGSTMTWTVKINADGTTIVYPNPTPVSGTHTPEDVGSKIVVKNYSLINPDQNSALGPTIYPRNGEMFKMSYNLSFATGSTIRSGDYFTIVYDKEIWPQGISKTFYVDDFIHPATGETLAIGSYNETTKTVTYTFTSAIEHYDLSTVSLSATQSLSVDRKEVQAIGYAVSGTVPIDKGYQSVDIINTIAGKAMESKSFIVDYSVDVYASNTSKAWYDDVTTYINNSNATFLDGSTSFVVIDDVNKTFTYYAYINPTKKTGNIYLNYTFEDINNLYGTANMIIQEGTTIVKVYDSNGNILPPSMRPDLTKYTDVTANFDKIISSKDRLTITNNVVNIGFGYDLNTTLSGKSYVVAITSSYLTNTKDLSATSKYKGFTGQNNTLMIGTSRYDTTIVSGGSETGTTGSYTNSINVVNTKITSPNELNILIQKKDSSGNLIKKGTLTLDIKNSAGVSRTFTFDLATSWTMVNGKEVLKLNLPVANFPSGSYTITETVAPNGFNVTKETFNIIINSDYSIDWIKSDGKQRLFSYVNGAQVLGLPISIVNEAVTGKFTLKKIDSQTGLPLSGVGFTLYDATEVNIIKTGVTDVNGQLLLEGLVPGKYVLKETNPPDGYIRENISYYITVAPNGSVTYSLSPDSTIPDVPRTGVNVDSLVSVISYGLNSSVKNSDGTEDYLYNAHRGETLILTTSLNVDNTVRGGDYLTLKLDPKTMIEGISEIFDPGVIQAPNGEIIAKGTFDPATETITYTFTNYVDFYDNVKVDIQLPIPMTDPNQVKSSGSYDFINTIAGEAQGKVTYNVTFPQPYKHPNYPNYMNINNIISKIGNKSSWVDYTIYLNPIAGLTGPNKDTFLLINKYNETSDVIIDQNTIVEIYKVKSADKALRMTESVSNNVSGLTKVTTLNSRYDASTNSWRIDFIPADFSGDGYIIKVHTLIDNSDPTSAEVTIGSQWFTTLNTNNEASIGIYSKVNTFYGSSGGVGSVPITNMVIGNTKAAPMKFELSKVDSSGVLINKGNLGIKITNSTGTNVYEKTFDLSKDYLDGSIGKVLLIDVPIEKFPTGTYKITETIAPDGYKLSTQEYTIEVDQKNRTITWIKSDGTKQLIYSEVNDAVVLNTLVLVNTAYTADIPIIKTDSEDSNIRINGVSFDLVTGTATQASTTIIQSKTTDTNGSLTFTGLKDGIYWIKETKPAPGYKENLTPIGPFTIKNGIVTGPNGSTITNATITNEPYLSNIPIFKTDASNGLKLDGVVFEIYNGDGIKAIGNPFSRMTTTNGGQVIFKDLRDGTYWIKEISTISGYQLPIEPWTGPINIINGVVTFSDKTVTETAPISITNKKNTPMDFYLLKKDQTNTIIQTGKLVMNLSGNGITQDYSFDLATAYVKNADGTVKGLKVEIPFDMFPSGTYTLKEISAPVGFMKTDITWSIQIDQEKRTIKLLDAAQNVIQVLYSENSTGVAEINPPIEVVNKRDEFPTTGGNGFDSYLNFGALLMLIALVLLLQREVFSKLDMEKSFVKIKGTINNRPLTYFSIRKRGSE